MPEYILASISKFVTYIYGYSLYLQSNIIEVFQKEKKKHNRGFSHSTYHSLPNQRNKIENKKGQNKNKQKIETEKDQQHFLESKIKDAQCKGLSLVIMTLS